MVQDVIKWAIATALIVGLTLAFLNLIGSLAKDFLLEKMNELSRNTKNIFGRIFFGGFILLIILLIVISIIILIRPIDFHTIFDPLK